MVFEFKRQEPRSKIKLNKTFLQAIMEGINPETGEVLSEDSAWRHPKIIEDISTYIDYGSIVEKVEKKEHNAKGSKISAHEFTIFCEAMQKVEQILPQLSERNVDLIRFYYDPKQTERRTLQETANKFGLSRERVRQIKEKTLRKVRFHLKKTKFSPPTKTILGDERFSKRIANEYLNDLLNSIVQECTKDQSQKPTEQASTKKLKNSEIKQLNGDYFKFETLDKFTPENDNHEFWRTENFDREYVNSKRGEPQKRPTA